MKKYIMIIPLVFFNMSTCMLNQLQALKKKIPRPETIKNLTTTTLKAIVTPKYSHPPREKYQTRKRSSSECLPGRTTAIDDSIKSYTHNFKEIVPPPTHYVTKTDMYKEIYKERNAQKEEISKIRIQDALVSVGLFTLSKIDYSWIFQTVKNFFNPNTQTNEA